MIFLTSHHRFCQLVGTGCTFISTEVAGQFCGNFLGFHALTEFGACLKVSVAAALKRNVINPVFVVFFKVNDSGTCALCLVSELFHERSIAERILPRQCLHRVQLACLYRGAQSEENSYEHAEHKGNKTRRDFDCVWKFRRHIFNCKA